MRLFFFFCLKMSNYSNTFYLKKKTILPPFCSFVKNQLAILVCVYSGLSCSVTLYVYPPPVTQCLNDRVCTVSRVPVPSLIVIVGRIMPPPDVHILIPINCECINFVWRMGF